MKEIIIKVEKFVFFRTGIIMPYLKRQWARDAEDIQNGLDHDRMLYDPKSWLSVNQPECCAWRVE